MKKLFLAAILILAGNFASAQTVFERTDTQKEIELGRAAYDQEVRDGHVSRNLANQQRVRRIVAQLAQSMPVRPYPFEAVVLSNNTVNAFCLKGGYIIVFEGLLTFMPNDEELAFTLGHEMGHAVRRHWARGKRRDQVDAIVDILGTVVSKGNYVQPDRSLSRLSYSRDQEREADSFGVELYLRSGYDPSKVGNAVKALLRYEQFSGESSPPEYLSTHPTTKSRLIAVELLAEKLTKAGMHVTGSSVSVDSSVEAIFGKLPAIAAIGNDMLPMIPGTKWEYQVGSGRDISHYECSCVGLSFVVGSQVARFEITMGQSVIPYQVMGDSSAIYRRNRPDRETSPWTTEILFPALGGDAEVGGTRFTKEPAETLLTPAGTFEKCSVLRVVDSKGRILRVWFAEGIGMVKRVNETNGNTETLVAFHRG